MTNLKNDNLMDILRATGKDAAALTNGSEVAKHAKEFSETKNSLLDLADSIMQSASGFAAVIRDFRFTEGDCLAFLPVQLTKLKKEVAGYLENIEKTLDNETERYYTYLSEVKLIGDQDKIVRYGATFSIDKKPKYWIAAGINHEELKGYFRYIGEDLKLQYNFVSVNAAIGRYAERLNKPDKFISQFDNVLPPEIKSGIEKKLKIKVK
jgi:hypothetical protein